jgi:hypothetical protein
VSQFPHPSYYNYTPEQAEQVLERVDPDNNYVMLHQVKGNNGFDYLQTGVAKAPKIGEVFYLKLKRTWFQTSLVVHIEEHEDGLLLHTINSIYFYKVLPLGK